MSTMPDECAACGRGDEDLKQCAACKMVKYCGFECQKNHRPVHKKACKQRAAELFDEVLFKQPPPRDDCPICFIRLPRPQETTYLDCCGKTVCNGCRNELLNGQDKSSKNCPFCRSPTVETDEIANMSKRIDAGDPLAMALVGFYYAKGMRGWPQDFGKAFELFSHAAELGQADAHYRLGTMYRNGNYVECDPKKYLYHLEQGAILGSKTARHSLGIFEGKRGNHIRAMKHLMIAISSGSEVSLETVHMLYKQGLVCKSDYDQASRSFQAYLSEVQSDQRDRAKAYLSEVQSDQRDWAKERFAQLK